MRGKKNTHFIRLTGIYTVSKSTETNELITIEFTTDVIK